LLSLSVVAGPCTPPAPPKIFSLSLHDALPISLTLLALRLLWKTPIFPSNSRFPRLCAKCLLKLKRLVSIWRIISAFLLNRSSDQIGRAVQQECRDRSRMPSSACKKTTPSLSQH